MSHLEGALAWHDAGMCVIPAMADGSKRPFGYWKDYQDKRPDRNQVDKWYKTSRDSGVGLICGTVSGGLEMLEIEAVRMDSESLRKVDVAMEDHGLADLWEMLTVSDHGYLESTPSGGIHLLYRIIDAPVPGNTKIAMDVTGKQTYAETRGEGGFVVVAPSHGTVHKSGDAWTCIAGRVGVVPDISWTVRNKIHAALREALDERVMPVYERPAGSGTYDRSTGDRPGDAFNDDPSVTIGDILTRNGWKYLGKSRGQERYVHPLSSDMTTHSACTGHQGSPNLYAWSGMPQEDFYDKFAVLAYLEHGGDFSAASAHLRTLGYGAPPQAQGINLDGWEFDDDAPSTTVEDQPKKPFLKEWTETGVAHMMVPLVGDQFRHVGEEKGWRTFDQGRWVVDETSSVEQAVEKATKWTLQKAAQGLEDAKETEDKDKISEAKSIYATAKGFRSARGINAITTRFSQQEKVGASVKQFDTKKNLLCLNNGTFDLDTMTLREHRPGDMLTKKIDVSYDPDAQCPGFLKFLESSIPDHEYRDYLRRALGMTTRGEIREAAFIVLQGPTGCGKSQFVKIAHALLGEYAATAASSTFRSTKGRGGEDTYDLHDLMGTRMASMSETSEGDVLNEELLKRITGGDNIKSRALYQKFIEWKPEFTVWVATNFLPRLNVDDDAIWRRVKVVKFPNQFKGDDAEIGLAERLIATELPGIFNWLLQGVRDYQEMGLKDPGSMTEQLEEYREEVDPVNEFLTDSIDEGTLVQEPQARMSSTELYRVYTTWCSANKRFAVNKNRFGRRMEAMGFKGEKAPGGIRVRIGLKAGTDRWLGEAQGNYGHRMR